jgi:hypothetical protein
MTLREEGEISAIAHRHVWAGTRLTLKPVVALEKGVDLFLVFFRFERTCGET